MLELLKHYWKSDTAITLWNLHSILFLTVFHGCSLIKNYSKTFWIPTVDIAPVYGLWSVIHALLDNEYMSMRYLCCPQRFCSLQIIIYENFLLFSLCLTSWKGFLFRILYVKSAFRSSLITPTLMGRWRWIWKVKWISIDVGNIP